MTPWAWLSVHHALSLITFVSTVALSAKILRTRRAVSSSTAWLLAIVLVPYVGIPAYLLVGERKLRHASRKPALALPVANAQDAEIVVDWLDRPEIALRRLLDEIRGAARTIHISTFLLADDEVGREVVAVLTQRARDGLEVCLLLDGLFAARMPRRLVAPLREAGGHVAVFLPLVHLPWRGRTNVRNHRKLAIFDDARAIIGGMNMAVEYLGPIEHPGRWRDLAVAVAGPPAVGLAQVFQADWDFAGGSPITAPPSTVGSLEVEVIATGPDHADDPWHDALLQRIFEARTRIWIATPYFAPNALLTRALEIAARRGVDVMIVVPARSNHWIADRVAGPMLRTLAAVGVRVERFGPAMLHAKCLLIDDELAAVGSANFDARSLFLDFEASVVLRGARHNQRLARWFDETVAGCDAGAASAPGLLAPVEAIAQLLAPFV